MVPVTRMTGGQALVRSMSREGVRTVFGIPGAGQYEIVDALWSADDIRYVSVRNEQATTYMADGYFRASHEIAGVVVVQGPGFFNTTAGLATAYDVSSPMLVVTGTNLYGHDAQEAGVDWTTPLTKWTGRVERPRQIPELVHEAMRQMRTGRPRPVLIQVDQPVLAAEDDVALLGPDEHHPEAPDADDIGRAAWTLEESTAPVIWAGGGVHTSSASKSLTKLAEYIQAPVVTSANGKGAISDRHPLSMGFAETRYEPLGRWLSKRDVVLAVGTRTPFPETAGRRTIRIDIDPVETTRSQHHTLGLTGDAKVTLETLLETLSRKMPPRPKTEHKLIAELLKNRFAAHNQLEPQRSLMDAIRSTVPDDGIVVQGMNQMGYYSRNYLPVYSSRGYMTSSHHSTLGHAFPVGLGAKLAASDRAVVVLSGDGGFQYNSQELATAVQYGINVVSIVFNDNAYGNVLRAQIEEFGGHVLGTRLHNPDFVALARSYGATAIKADGPEELGSALSKALERGSPTLIEVPVGDMERVY